jgi:aspartyl-tRNA(Asn)/glutamyl-tRNA(Gln) amidotransferase subunit A
MDPTLLSVADVAPLLQSGELSPVELTEAYLTRVEDVDPGLNTYVVVLADSARGQARQAQEEIRAGRWRGPLHGVPLGVKDLYDLAGVPTTAGSPLLADNVPSADSTVVARLRDAGAVLLGKHSTHEFAWGGTTNNPHFGPTRNPHDPGRVPGGSSGGSASAVVARTAAASVGSDTCGSVRIPAALSGCVGFKPTYGRISLHRVVPLCPSLDHGGPITRTVRDAGMLFMTLAGFDAADARTLPLDVPDVLTGLDGDVQGLRIGRLRGWFEAVLDPDVRAAVDAAMEQLRGLGCVVRDVVPEAQEAPVDDVFLQVAGEALPWHWATFGRGAAGYSPAMSELLAGPVPAADAVAQGRERTGAQVRDLLTMLADVDLLTCATIPAPAPRIGEQEVDVGGRTMHVEWMLTRLTSVFDAARLPALSVPCGWSRNGLPIGLQLVGRHLDEATVLQAGSAFELAVRQARQPAASPGR